MTKSNSTVQVLAGHERRIARLEALVGATKSVKRNTSKKITLSGHILALRDSGFFSQARIVEETHDKLSQNYHCDLNRVAVELYRVATRKQLRKTSKRIEKKTYQAYVW